MAAYRNDETLERIKRWFVLVAFVGIGFGGIGLVRLATDGGTALASASSATLAAFGLVGLLLVRRTTRVSVRTSAEGVEIRNMLSTRRFPWSEVAAFEDIPRPRGVAQIRVRTRSGKAYPVSACGDAGPACKRIVRSLDEKLASSRAG